jgi:Rod binding domain-containing protein
MTALPPIDDRVLPADVRAGTRADKTRYKTALNFERELVSQLTQQLADTTRTQGDDDGGDSTGASASTESYRQMLPGVLADSIMQSGGLGLARGIAENMKETGK